MREFDRLARAFLAEIPDGVIVDLGCGLDTRFERVDDGQVELTRLERRMLDGDVPARMCEKECDFA
jgi:O-methyltransferase involved in polyketide biosynthesis